jgi:hypothetical protein
MIARYRVDTAQRATKRADDTDNSDELAHVA